MSMGHAGKKSKNQKMKKVTKILAALAVIASANSANAEVAKYSVESNHAFVVWSADHFGFSKQMGKFYEITGEINFDSKKVENSSVDVTINTNSLSTGLSKFDEHLKSQDFLDVKKFPTAKFVSKKITGVGKDKAKVEGDLTLHGVTKAVVLDAKINKVGVNPISQKETVGFSALTTIKRSDFGIKYALPNIADEVKLMIEVEANK